MGGEATYKKDGVLIVNFEKNPQEILRPSPFFFVFRMRFLILGRSDAKIKIKNAKIKLEKEPGARRPGTSA